MAVDLSVFEKIRMKKDYDRAEEEFQLKKKLSQAEIFKAQQLDVDKLGEIGFMKAAQGLELTPQERAAAQYVDAKSGGISWNPVSGEMIQKPRISDKIGLGGMGQQQAQPSASYDQNIMNPASESKNPYERLYEDAMGKAKGNPRLQQNITDAYLKNQIELTEGQANAGLFADRMKQAETTLESPETMESGMSLKNRIAGSVPVVGNYLVGSEYQKLDQAERDFINAVLRRESGAVISPGEFANAQKQYFPQPGDKPEVLKQKQINRQNAINGIERAAGRAYEAQIPSMTMEEFNMPYPGGRTEPPPAPVQPSAAPSKGQVMDGYVYLGGDPAKQSSWKKAR